MNTIGWIVVIAIIIVGVVIYLVKTKKLADSDGDYIPDVVEDAADDVKEKIEDVKATVKEIKRRAKNVKEELSDVFEEAQEVVDALKGKVTKSKLRNLTKKQLQAHSKKEFDVEMEDSLTKSNMINQVYSLHHKK